MSDKALVVGSGSIARRHALNLYNLGLSVDMWSRGGGKHLDGETLRCVNLIDLNLNKWSASDYLVAVICSKTCRHLEDFFLASRFINSIYLEKPLSSSECDYRALLDYANDKKLHVECGFMMRRHPCVQFVSSLLKNGALGKICSASFFVGQWLPDWRPNTDHRLSYSARISEGGGVVLDLIHEIDLIRFLLGEVECIASVNSYPKHLEIETEGVANSILQIEGGINVQLHQNYVQPGFKRFFEIVGEYGSVYADLGKNFVRTFDLMGCEQSVFEDFEFERNDMFFECMDQFISQARELTRQNKAPQQLEVTSNLRDGVEAIRIALAAKKSSKRRQFITLLGLGEQI